MSSSLVEQLTTKLMQMQKKASDINASQSRRTRIANDTLLIEVKINNMKAELDKTAAMHKKLVDRNTELNQQLQAKQQEQDDTRVKIQAEMKEMMDKVSSDVDAAHQQFEAASIDNANIKHQLESLDTTIAAGEGKLDSIMNQGTEERAALIAKGEAAEKECEELTKKLEEIMKPIEEAKQQHDELRHRVTDLMKISSELQGQIGEVSEKLSVQRRTNDSLAAKEKKLDNDLRHEIPKLDKVRAEFKTVTSEAAALEQQKDSLENQIKKLQGLCDTLSSGVNGAVAASE